MGRRWMKGRRWMMAARRGAMRAVVSLAGVGALFLSLGCETKRPNGASCLKDRDCESERCRSGSPTESA